LEINIDSLPTSRIPLYYSETEKLHLSLRLLCLQSAAKHTAIVANVNKCTEATSEHYGTASLNGRTCVHKFQSKLEYFRENLLVRARIVDFFLIAISRQSPRQYRDIVTVARCRPAGTRHMNDET